MGARMFTAILPPSEVITALDALLEPRRDADDALRWTRPEGWHITMSFMGDVPDHSLERLVGNLAEVAGRARPIDVQLVGGVAFPHAAKARILALGAAGEPELGELSNACRAAGSRAGVEVDGARFVGHLTLARHRRGLSATHWLDVLDSFPRWRWQADELCLVQSHPGARYEVIERFPFGGGGAVPLD